MSIAPNHIFRISALLATLLFAASSLPAQPSPASADGFRAAPEDVARPAGLPSIGKWMIAPDLAPAHWLGEIYEDKKLREPINVVIVDAYSRTPKEAKAALLQAATLAGFPSREGHSGGYWGWIGDRLHPQFPDTAAHAFSDEPYELNNNHGRFFGPYRYEDAFIFVGAVSREKVAPLSTPRHQYVSFNRGRDTFAEAMDLHSAIHRIAYVNLDNALIDRPDLSTGDHDGMAAVLTRRP
ncbi:MAG: hypothetical protein ACXWJM_09375 [Ramlibacter sp.]